MRPDSGPSTSTFRHRLAVELIRAGVDVAAAPIASKRSVMPNRGRWAQIGPRFAGLTPSMPWCLEEVVDGAGRVDGLQC